MRSPYRPVRSELKDVVSETSNIKTFVLEPEEPLAFKAGQFVELTVPGLGEAPFTPSSSPSEAERLAISIMEAGRVTAALHRLDVGAVLGLRGPYGNEYPLDGYAGKDILILGGGVGLAPLRSLLLALLEERDRFGRIVLCYGARSPGDLIYKDQLPQWTEMDGLEVHLTVDNADDTWQGKVGVVTTVLDDVSMDFGKAITAVCGPPVMMKFGTLALLDKGFLPANIYLSMEKNMSCGIGQCGHCRLGPYYVCRDGPVFTYEQLQDVANIW
jgi:NAD(P)H-flavin reductase